MSPRQAFRLLTHLGPGWCVFRLRYAWRLKSGALRRATPAAPWSAFANAYAEGRLPAPERGALPADAAVVAEADAVMAGRFRLYSEHAADCGFPPAWNTDPFTRRAGPAGVHWTRIPDFAGGDIKDVWELSRFPWAFALVRAHARDGAEARAEAFWTLFTDWLAANPPNLGPQWKCGQEATFRLLAAAFARHAFSGCAATTPARLDAWRAFVLATGRRIAANLDYALSQSNNHGVSECVGLLTGALLLPGAPEAARWHATGLAGLRRQCDELVYADGSFSQHSVNYHRVLLHDLCWAAALLRANGAAVPPWLGAAGARALGWLEQVVEPASGRAAWSGSNDGAHILPLAPGGYADFRPALALASALFRGLLPPVAGPWDEAAAWLAPGVRERDCASAAPAGDFSARDGGWWVLRRGESRVMLRAPERFRHRPAQADLLHLDVWWRGVELTADPGSYAYNTDGPFAAAFKPAAVHNTVTVDGLEPLRKAGRFLYLPWPTGRVIVAADGSLAAGHSGWADFGVAHRRTVRHAAGGWIIEDRVRSDKPRRARLHWLFADAPHEFDPTRSELRLRTAAGVVIVRWTAAAGTATLVRADPNSDRGWASPAYRLAVPALSLAIEAEVAGEITLVTAIVPSPAESAR